MRNGNMPAVSYVFLTSVAVFCRKTIRAARCKVVSSALTTGLLTQLYTGVQCDSVGSLKACRMWQRQFVFNADPMRLRTPSIFAADFCVRVE